ncbi:Poly(A) polymerase [Neurospora tetrasperma FGSC 2508]|uniref:Poly(A) polymerase n=1 Tax=Neurospora tetrasperma (strain FGSC 2508 / ATCC MYA-4615 / P0657) TaxID=510951 RepID=F8MKD8_NEUT8|nr:Poly(A) polymerase [Neurospora tetrasperma FGSC 2508]EGO58219.1 Poly(A) polymerase [Neurospora tetrasperma FGSC 2508]EGZ71465.1 Poly(A) polymerase [Neurospora tetrasperma FGSC 2509]
MSNPEHTLGVTPPISTALPTDAEKRQTEALLKELRAQGTFESQAETDKRWAVLADLQRITDEFVKRAAQEKEPHNAILIRDARGRIFTYGSFRLGVYGPGSDIDTLVVVPKYVTVKQYFDIFPNLLVEMAPPGAITDLTPVPEAFVPIIKFEYSGISIDLIFCSIQSLRQLPDDKDWNLNSNNLLRGLSENEVRSLNGTRVTDEILALVPEEKTFKLALRAIKLWAQRRAIYANIMGYPGGVAWAMLVARVCQLYPKATSAVIVRKFFTIMLNWPWPLPVLLKNIEYNQSITRVAVWNPKIYPSDRNHKMPIITPSYPSMCATHNVGRSSMAVIQQELERGVQISEEIMLGKRPWKDLFEKHTFFTNGFKFYLTVISSGRTKEAQNTWSGFVESRVRVLVQKLELHPSIALARPFNKGYDRVHRCKTDAQVEEIQTGNLTYMVKPTDTAANGNAKNDSKVEIKAEIKTEDGVAPEPAVPVVKEEPNDVVHLGTVPLKPEDNSVKPEANDYDEDKVKLEDIPEKEPELEIYTTNHYIGLQLVEGAKSLDLSREVDDFKAMCTSNDIFKAELMGLTIQHVRNFDLPDDVFEPGETKPVRPVKKKKRMAEGEHANGPMAKRQQMATAPPTIKSEH